MHTTATMLQHSSTAILGRAIFSMMLTRRALAESLTSVPRVGETLLQISPPFSVLCPMENRFLNAFLPSIQASRMCYPERASTPELLPCKRLYMVSKMMTRGPLGEASSNTVDTGLLPNTPSDLTLRNGAC